MHRSEPKSLLTERNRRLKVIDVDRQEAEDEEESRLSSLSERGVGFPDWGTDAASHFSEMADDRHELLDDEDWDEIGFVPTKLRAAYAKKLDEAEAGAKKALDYAQRAFKTAQQNAQALRRKHNL